MSASSDLGSRVGAVTQAVAVLALTATGGLVSWFAQQAKAADAAKARAQQPTAPVVVPRPVQRPVRTVVVRRTVPADAREEARRASGARMEETRAGSVSPRNTARGASGSSSSGPSTSAPRPAPVATQAPAATTSSGS